MVHFLWCHGFGCTTSFWDALLPYFSHASSTVLDLGYFHTPQTQMIPQDHVVGIGHSFGFIKLLELDIHFTCIIGLNAFTHFLGKDPVLRKKREIEFAVFKKKFLHQPIVTVRRFHQLCGIPTFPIEHCNMRTLTHDLNLLASNPSRTVLKHIERTPMLIMGCTEDPVVPPELIQDNFLHHAHVVLHFLDCGTHALGVHHTDYLHKTIMKFSQTNH